MNKKNSVIILITLSVIAFFFVGFLIGYIYPRDVHIEVIETSGKYVTYYKVIQDYLSPFNETDRVDIFMMTGYMMINHTVPNEIGIRYFNIGYDADGWFTYITQLRRRE